MNDPHAMLVELEQLHAKSSRLRKKRAGSAYEEAMEQEIVALRQALDAFREACMRTCSTLEVVRSDALREGIRQGRAAGG